MQDSGLSNFCWGYDSFGNRTSAVMSNHAITGDGAHCTPQDPNNATWMGSNVVYTAANQIDHPVDPVTGAAKISPVAYDASGSGDTVQSGLDGVKPVSYLYDGEDRVCAVLLPPAVPGLPSQMFQYLYDAEGNRVAKGTITQWNCDTDSDTNGNGFTLTNEYVLDTGGEQISELGPNGAWMHTNAYAGGQIVATLDAANNASYANPATHYQFSDWLGTRRMQVDPSGNMEEAARACPSATSSIAPPAQFQPPTTPLNTTSPAKKETPNPATTTSRQGTTTPLPEGSLVRTGALKKSQYHTQS